MKIIMAIFVIFSYSVLSARISKPETIYNQIPPIPHQLCKSTGSTLETKTLIESFSVQLEEMRYTLTEESKKTGDETYNTISAGFPTDEELKKADKLSEAEQKAFWQKIEADQARFDQAVACNTLKYQAERETLNKKVADYQNKLLAISEELSKIHTAAMKVKSDKRQNIYNTCMANNSLTVYGEQQLEEICVEFCSVVSPVLLKKLRFEYDHLKQNMSLYRRLTVIELVEFSLLAEEEVCEKNAALLDLNDLEILVQFINNYKILYNILPGAIDNQK